MTDPYKKLLSFLKKYKVSEKPYTHLSCKDPAGAYRIPDDQIKKFHQLYDTVVKLPKSPLTYILETNPETYAPLKIDIDLKTTVKPEQRLYTQEELMFFLKKYIKLLVSIVDVKHNFNVVITEKPQPTHKPDNCYKDGFHVLFPDIIVNHDTAFFIREQVLKQKIIEKSFKSITPINPASDIIDKCIIKQNNWPMINSIGKPDSTLVYTISHILQYNTKGKVINMIDYHTIPNISEYLSIRNKSENVFINEQFKQLLNPPIRQKTIVSRPRQQNPPEYTELEDLSKVRYLVSILSPERATDYSQWIQVGWCLHNINSRELYNDFLIFSQKCPEKYSEEVCQKVWDKAKESGLTVASLYFWAKHDSPNNYNSIVSNKIDELNNGHVDIAKILHELYGHEYIHCQNLNKWKNGWYRFSNNRWIFEPDGCSLRNKLTGDLKDIYMNYIRTNQELLTNADITPSQKTIYNNNIKEATNIATKKLTSSDFLSKTLLEATFIFRDPNFQEKLDRNPYLLPFKNGVFDLQLHQFREGVPHDYTSMTCGMNFQPSDNLLNKRNLIKFIEDILPNKAVREYALTVLASSLDYVNREEKFYIIIGSGRNGKSLLMQLHQEVLGNFSCALPVSLITQKRADSSKPVPEVVKMDLKRHCLIKEPDTANISLNTGIIKELTGNDLISARNLYENDNEFRVASKLMLMTNTLPDVYSDDPAIWDRIRVIEFPVHFCDPKDIKDPNIDKPIDNTIKSKLPDWKQSYIELLLEYYKKYKTQATIPEPPEVSNATLNYRERNNTLLQFITEKIENKERSNATISELYNVYTYWFNEWYQNKKIASKKEFDAYFRTYYGLRYVDGIIKKIKIKEQAIIHQQPDALD